MVWLILIYLIIAINNKLDKSMDMVVEVDNMALDRRLELIIHLLYHLV